MVSFAETALWPNPARKQSRLKLVLLIAGSLALIGGGSLASPAFSGVFRSSDRPDIHELQAKLSSSAVFVGAEVSGTLTLTARSDRVRLGSVDLVVYPYGVDQRTNSPLTTTGLSVSKEVLEPNEAISIPFSWDQKTASGDQVPPGTYVLVLRSRGEAIRGNSGVAATTLAQVDVAIAKN